LDYTIVHIGYHKTGTSFLQDTIFAKHANIFHRISQREIFDYFIYPDPLELDEAKVSAFVDHHLSYARERNLIPVFSNERLSGGLHTGGGDSVEIAQRIKRFIPNARIIIGIREQQRLILSAYAQYIKAVGSFPLQEYLAPETSKSKSLFHVSYLEYDRLINYYFELFGRENILVIPYELLKLEKERYFTLLKNFLLVEDKQSTVFQTEKAEKIVNPSLKASVLLVKRYFNPFILKGHLHLGNTLNSKLMLFLFRIISGLLKRMPTNGIDQRIQEKNKHLIANTVGTYYQQSNLRTMQLIEMDLAALGYALPEKNKL
jgi:hypothetical protein